MGKKTVRGHDIANRFVYSLKQPLYIFLIMAVLSIQFYHIFNSLTGGIFHFDLPVPKSLFYFIFDI